MKQVLLQLKRSGLVAFAAFASLGAMCGVASAQSGADAEIVYLTNCDHYRGGVFAFTSSEIDWYRHTSGSQHQEKPGAISIVGDGANFVTWEGRSVTGTFADGNSFTSNIKQDGSGGVGRNNFHAFTCRRQDDKRQLYSESETKCYALYYCTPS